MLNLVHCELLKLKRSKMVLISILGVLSTPCLMFAEALQNHFRHPERIITLSDIYSNSLMYVMLLTNMVIYVAIIAYLFSREYSEHTLKTILPIPISRTRLLIVKFFTLFLWIIMLTGVTWIGIFILSGGTRPGIPIISAHCFQDAHHKFHLRQLLPAHFSRKRK